MDHIEKAKEITSRLYEFQGADFSNQTTQFRFCKAVKECVEQLMTEGILVRSDDNLLGPFTYFMGVTFEDSNEYPTYVYRRINGYY